MTDGSMKVFRMLTTLLVCLALLFAFFVSVIQVFGFDLYGVLTSSMKPAIPPGSMIYLRDVEPDQLRIGDVITYSVSTNVMATHRIVDIIPDENNPLFFRFQTKGDANPTVDAALVEPKKIIGKVAFSIPALGSVAHFIQKPPGIYVAIALSAVLVILVLLTDTATAEKMAGLRKKANPEGTTTQEVAYEPLPVMGASVQPIQPAYGAQLVMFGQAASPPAGYVPPQIGYGYGASLQRCQPVPQQPMPMQAYDPAYQRRSAYARPSGAPIYSVSAARSQHSIRQQTVQHIPNATFQQPAPYGQYPMMPATGSAASQSTAAPPDMPQQRRRRRAADFPTYQ